MAKYPLRYPLAINSHDQPQVNSLTDYARQCTKELTYRKYNDPSMEFSQAFYQIHILTGLPTSQLVPYFNQP